MCTFPVEAQKCISLSSCPPRARHTNAVTTKRVQERFPKRSVDDREASAKEKVPSGQTLVSWFFKDT